MSSSSSEGVSSRWGADRNLADQLYALYAEGRDLRRLIAVVGEGSLSEADRRALDFADDFERRFVHPRRASFTRPDDGSGLGSALSDHPDADLKLIPPKILAGRPVG